MNSATNLYEQATAKFDLADYHGAIADYSKAIKLEPDYAEAYSNRGSAREYLNDYQGASDDYTQAITQNPNFAEAHYLRGSAKLKLSQNDDAQLDFARARELGYTPLQDFMDMNS